MELKMSSHTSDSECSLEISFGKLVFNTNNDVGDELVEWQMSPRGPNKNPKYSK